MVTEPAPPPVVFTMFLVQTSPGLMTKASPLVDHQPSTWPESLIAATENQLALGPVPKVVYLFCAPANCTKSSVNRKVRAFMVVSLLLRVGSIQRKRSLNADIPNSEPSRQSIHFLLESVCHSRSYWYVDVLYKIIK